MLNALQNHLPLPNWNVKSNSVQPTNLHVLAARGQKNSYTAKLLSTSEKTTSFICSESHWMLSGLHGYPIQPSVTCLEFTPSLSTDKNWRTFIGMNLNFLDLSDSDHLLKQLQVHPRFYTTGSGVHNLQNNSFALSPFDWKGKQLYGCGDFLGHNSWSRK